MPGDKDLWVGDNLVRSESQKRHKRIPTKYNIRFKKAHNSLVFDSDLTLNNLFVKWRTDWEISGVLLQMLRPQCKKDRYQPSFKLLL